MTSVTEQGAEAQKKSNKKASLAFGVLLAAAGAGGGFYAVHSGLLHVGDPAGEAHAPKPAVAVPDIAFVRLDPIVVSLTGAQELQHLRFQAQLEVEDGTQKDVEKMLPRVTDVLNGYLRALEISDLRDPLALTRLRAQILRRVQIVVGEGRVRDVLIMEFVLN